VSSVLDLDDLLQKNPEPHFAAHQLHGLLGLSARPQREELSIAYARDTPKKSSSTSR
jgi:hypothetical protein